MKPSISFRLLAGACLLTAVALGALVACAEPDETEADRGGEAPGSGSTVVGLTELPDGRVEATGYLDFIELEGGFWAIVDADPREEASEDPSVIMIVVNASELGLPPSGSPETADFVGLAARAVGERLEGASVRMAGPEMVAESLVIADDVGALDEPDEL